MPPGFQHSMGGFPKGFPNRLTRRHLQIPAYAVVPQLGDALGLRQAGGANACSACCICA
jgi:hypothetical protein